jgi:hypothetical protein
MELPILMQCCLLVLRSLGSEQCGERQITARDHLTLPSVIFPKYSSCNFCL